MSKDEPGTSLTAADGKPDDNCAVGNIDGALENLDQLKTEEAKSNITVLKQSSMDMQQKMSCQFGKLDTLLNKAENAQYAMAQQTKDMRGLMK